MKSTWLWDATMMTSQGNSILDFCRKNSVDVLYLQWSSRATFTEYREFISLAAYLGIKVHACMGERTWYDPENYSAISVRLNDLGTYQQTSNIESQFTGVHFDIEPHTLPEWKTNQADVVAKWEQTVKLYAADVRTLGLELSASVPFSISVVPDADGQYLSEFMIDQHDKVVVMAYRDFAEGTDSILWHSERFLVQAEDMKVPNVIVIGVETKDTTEGDKLTFAQEGKMAMRRELRTVDFIAGGYSSYAGHAVHAVNYWRDLQL